MVARAAGNRADVAGYMLRPALVAVIYYVAARLSLQLALVHGQVTPVWPPTGIALVAILVLGPRVWPAIALAALAVNLPLGPNPAGAAMIAAGNTLAPLTAAYLMRSAGFRLELDHLSDAAALIFLGALVGMAVSATVGTFVLVVFGTVPSASFAQTWSVWWTGDAMGVLLVAPFLLSLWQSPSPRLVSWSGTVELAGLLAAVALLTFAVFQNRFRLEYVVFPLIAIAALRFRLRGAAAAALIASLVAVWAAVNNAGPFADETLLQKMVTLQVFNVFLALSSFVLVAYVATREREQKARLSSEAKSEFLRVASHELRGPLTVLAGYLTLLSSGDLGDASGRWRGPLEVLTAKTAELSRIMDELLEVSRLDGELTARSRKVVDLQVVVEEAVERARARAELTGAEIAREATGRALHVIADADQIGHVMDNLLNNALSYSPNPARITVTCAVEGERAVVRISDNGVGMAEEIRAGLFEPFRRGRQPGVEDVAGTGLGLYLSRELAASHGGSVVLERSEPGQGSTFALWLPRARVTEPSLRA
jgi:signal transduction histidine kinase